MAAGRNTPEMGPPGNLEVHGVLHKSWNRRRGAGREASNEGSHFSGFQGLCERWGGHVRKTFVPSLFGYFVAVSDHFGDGRPGNRGLKNERLGTWMITLDLEVYIFNKYIGCGRPPRMPVTTRIISCFGLGMPRSPHFPRLHPERGPHPTYICRQPGLCRSCNSWVAFCANGGSWVFQVRDSSPCYKQAILMWAMIKVWFLYRIHWYPLILLISQKWVWHVFCSFWFLDCLGSIFLKYWYTHITVVFFRILELKYTCKSRSFQYPPSLWNGKLSPSRI